MNKRYIVLWMVGMLTAQLLHAQYSQDAFRFSSSDRGGSARIRALGGTSTALGGDVSNIALNPAGLGFFNSSEASITPEMNGFKTTSTYFGDANSRNSNKFNLGNISVVFNSPQQVYQGTDPSKGILSVNYGISWNRTNNFNQNVFYQGLNSNNSFADMLSEHAYNNGPSLAALKGASSPLGWWGWDHFLIDTIGRDNTGLLYEPNTEKGGYQTVNHVTTGGQNELNFALGANISNKLYLGGSIGFANISYDSHRTFSEDGKNFIRNQDYNIDFQEVQRTRASGFNFKMGLIYRPVKSVQLGANFTSPTWYAVDDEYTVGMITRYKNSDAYKGDPEYFASQYNLRTPLKVSGGATVFIQQRGFISADVEYVGYKSMKVDGYDGANLDNNTLNTLYKNTVNARVGAEGRVTENFYLRAGYAYLGNPQKEIGSATTMITGGLGYRVNRFSVDATFVNSSRDANVYGYELYNQGAISPEASLKQKQNSGYLTFAYRF